MINEADFFKHIYFMMQAINWEKEYKNSLFVTKKAKPQNDVLRFLRFWKEQNKTDFIGKKVLDLGSGTGRNSNYLAQLGSIVVGLEIAQTALEIARQRTETEGLQNVTYLKQSIGEEYALAKEAFDLILDVTASNALTEKERAVYLAQTYRVLKPGGYFFVRALCKDGDKNAKKMLQKFPGKEKDTYVMPKSGLVERVFSEQDIRSTYGKQFEIVKLLKKSGYTKFDGQPYKRNYWLVYLKKA